MQLALRIYPDIADDAAQKNLGPPTEASQKKSRPEAASIADQADTP
jgi:hypothetical protein